MFKIGIDIYSWKGFLSFLDKVIEGKGDGGRWYGIMCNLRLYN